MLFILYAEWDSDMASLLVLLHLLTPQPAGRKRPKKISVSDATDHLVKFHKVCAVNFNPIPNIVVHATSFF